MWKKLMALFVLGLASTASMASVVYRWTTVESSPSMYPIGMSLELEFTDAAVQAGYLNFESPNCTSRPECTTDVPLLSMKFSIAGRNSIVYFPGYMGNPIPHGGPSNVELDIFFLTSGRLAGTIYAVNWESDFHLQSTGDLFRVLGVGSDAGVIGCGYDHCGGATGFIAQVPEPLSPALVLVGLAGLALTRGKPSHGVKSI